MSDSSCPYRTLRLIRQECLPPGTQTISDGVFSIGPAHGNENISVVFMGDNPIATIIRNRSTCFFGFLENRKVLILTAEFAFPGRDSYFTQMEARILTATNITSAIPIPGTFMSNFTVTEDTEENLLCFDGALDVRARIITNISTV